MNKAKQNFKKIISGIFSYKEEYDYGFVLQERYYETVNLNDDINDNLKPLEKTDNNLTTSLQENLDYIKVKYNSLINSDIKIREFILNAKEKQHKAFLLYIDGMIDSKMINNYILKPLILKNRSNMYNNTQKIVSNNNINIKKVNEFNLLEYIHDCLIPQNEIKEHSQFKDIFSSVNGGDCALFIDTLDIAFTMDVKGFSKRSIDIPNNEVVIKGAQEAFIENIRTNTTLLRRIVNNENLIIEDLSVGIISQTKCAVCYINNIVNPDLVAEIKYRINNLSIDYLISSRTIRTIN